MIIIKIISLLIIVKNAKNSMCNDIKLNAGHVKLYNSSKVIESSDCGVHGISFQFRLPIMDMKIQNDRNVLVMQEHEKQETFVLHGNELFFLNVSRIEKRLFLIGTLGGSVKEMDPKAAEILAWHDYYILVISLEDYLEIYQLPMAIIENRAKATKISTSKMVDVPPTFESIQQISFHGHLQKLFLINPNAEDGDSEHAMIIMAMNFTKLYAKLQTFFWTNTYFEQVEELTTPAIHEIHIVGNRTKYLVNGRLVKHQSKIILTISEIASDTMTLRNVQTLTVNSKSLHAMTFRLNSYLIACSPQQGKCNLFRMSDGVFSFYKQRSNKELTFEKLKASKYFLVGVMQQQVMIYTNARLDCYASFSSNLNNVDSIFVQNNQFGEAFVLLIYKSHSQMLVRMVEVETKNGTAIGAKSSGAFDIGEDISAMGHQEQHQHLFEDSVGKLRSLLLKRKRAMDLFLTLNVRLKPSEFQVPYPVNILSGRVKRVKVVGRDLLSPMQLRNRINELHSRYRDSGRFQRSSTQQQEQTSDKQKLSARKLYVKNLVYHKDLIEGFYLDKKTSSMPLLSIRSKLITTKNLTTPRLLTRKNLSQRNPRENANLTNPLDFIKVRKLIVKNINDVNWDKFLDGLLLKERDTKIEGRLILQAPTNVTHLNTKVLNGLIVENLFNLKEPQVVQSNLLFSGFFVNDLQAESVNGLDFANDIVFRGNKTFIESPVIMYEASIANDLLLGDNVTAARDATADFRQHYTGKVVINGSLTVNSLKRDTLAKSRIFVDGKLFSPEELNENYLLKNKTQHFKNPVVFGNSKVVVPHLNTTNLNGLPVNTSYLLQTTEPESHKPLLLAFMKANVNGTFTTNDPSNRIANLSRDAIRPGDQANITGFKTFEAPLTIDHLKTLSLDSKPVSDLVLKSELKKPLKFKDTKSFDSIEIKNSTNVEDKLNAEHMNQMPLEELLNYNYNLDSVYLPFKLNTKNIIFDKINDVPLDKIFKKFSLQDGQLILHKDLIIEGNAHFFENLNVTYINGIHWPSYEQNLARVNENAFIESPVCFLDSLTISKSLSSPSINRIELHKIFNNIFRKFVPQEVTGVYTFKNLHCSNLDVAVINDVPTETFIDIRADNITIDGDIIAPKVIVGNDFYGEFPIELPLDNLSEKLSDLTKRDWKNVVVFGNAEWNATGGVIDKKQTELLAYLHKNAVLKTGSQTITGNIHLVYPTIRKMTTKTALSENIDLEQIAADCLLKRANHTQVVEAPKSFLMTLHTKSIEANSTLRTYLLNGIDVTRFDASLYRLSSGDPINAELNFVKPPIIGHLVVLGNINSIEPSSIYVQSSKMPVPPLVASEFFIENATYIGEVNGMSIDNLLRNRLLKDGPATVVYGSLTFEDMALSGEASLKSINTIPIDDLVFKKSDNLQAVLGSKEIKGNLILYDPVTVKYLNGQDLAEAYQRSIFVDRDYYFDKLMVDEATFENGLIFSSLSDDSLSSDRSLNDDGDDDVDRKLAEKMEKHAKLDEIANELKSITDEINNSSGNGEAKEMLYLDYASHVDVVSQLAPKDIALDRVLIFEKPTSSLCERELLQVQISTAQLEDESRTIYLSNVSSHFVRANLNEISVKAENYCQKEYRKVKSKITIANRKISKVIGMKKYIKSVAIASVNSSEYFVILHAVDLLHNHHEIRVLKVKNELNNNLNISDWQSLTFGIGNTMRLFHKENRFTLLSSGYVNQQPSLVIYEFLASSRKFKLMQTIEGKYDIIEMVAHPLTAANETQLLLSCSQCQSLSVYKRSSAGEEAEEGEEFRSKFEIFQILKFNIQIDKIFAFKLSKESAIYMMILSEHEQDYYHLYKFSHIQGWLPITHGFYHNIEMALPLQIGQPANGIHEAIPMNIKDILLLLCSSKKCNVVEAIVK